jgi:fucose permease
MSKRLIPAAILAILVYGMIAALLGTLLPDLSRRFSFSDDQNGTIAFVQSLGLIIASLSIGPLIDRKGKKFGLVLGLGLITVALFALANAQTFALVSASMLLLGLGGGMVVTGANALVSDISPDRRSSTLNLLNLFFGLGGLLTPLIGAYLFAGNALGLCYLIAALTASTFLLHVVTPMPPPTGARGFKLSEAGKLAGNPALALMSLFLFLYVACEVGVWNWLAKHLVAQGIPEVTALRTLSLGFALGILVGRVVVSRILIRISPINVTLASSILMALTTWGMLQTNDPVFAGILVFCAGLAMAPVFPTTLGMVGDRFPVMTATAMGIAITCGWIGLAVSSKIIGAIAGNDSGNLKTALLVLPAFSVLMILVNLLLRTTLRRPITAN